MFPNGLQSSKIAKIVLFDTFQPTCRVQKSNSRVQKRNKIAKIHCILQHIREFKKIMSEFNWSNNVAQIVLFATNQPTCRVQKSNTRVQKRNETDKIHCFLQHIREFKKIMSEFNWSHKWLRLCYLLHFSRLAEFRNRIHGFKIATNLFIINFFTIHPLVQQFK